MNEPDWSRLSPLYALGKQLRPLCPDCKGDGRRLNPALQVIDHGITVQVLNPDRLPLLVRCTSCAGSGQRRDPS